MQQVKINQKKLEKMMFSVCEKANISRRDSKPIIENYLTAEILGKKTHGLLKFCFESRYFPERIGNPFIVSSTGPLVKVDGNKEVGPLAAEYCVDICTKRAKKYGICIVGVSNIQRYGILGTWVNSFAEKKLFGVVMNTCESAMSGFQGKKKVLGTNPIAFTFPTQENTFTIDMSTSKVAMSTIWLAKSEKISLPDDSFLDAEGDITTDPDKAKAVQPFGGLKGFNIALLVQLLSGSVFGFKMGSKIKNMYDIGYIFLAIDPSKTTSFASMIEENTELLSELRESSSVIPGSRSIEKTSIKEILVNEKVLKELQALGGTI